MTAVAQHRADNPHRTAHRRRDSVMAPATLAALSLHLPGFGLVPIGPAFTLANFTAMYGVMFRRRSLLVRMLLPACAAALLCGVLWRVWSAATGVTTRTSWTSTLEVAIWVAAFPLATLGGAYALEVVGPRRGLLWLTVGALVGGVAYYGVQSVNPWKYGLGFPVGLAIIYLASRYGRTMTVVAAFAVAVISFANSSRSAGTAAALTAVLGMLPAGRNARGMPLRIAVGGAVLAAVTFVVDNAMRLGLLGAKVQRVYIGQTEGGRNLLVSGRVEWQATFSLLARHPFGYGIGTVPEGSLQYDAIAQVQAAGGNIASGYYERAVFSARVDLHSITADLWYHCGPGGVLLAVVVFGILIYGGAALSTIAGHDRTLALIGYYVITNALWDMLFSPMLAVDQVTIALAVAVWAIRHARPTTRRQRPRS